MVVAVAVGAQEVRLEGEEGDVDGDAGAAGAAGAEDKAGAEDEDAVDDQEEPENPPDVYRRGSKERRWN